MSDYVDDMLQGMFCSSCGEYLGEGEGYPEQCAGCQEEGIDDVCVEPELKPFLDDVAQMLANAELREPKNNKKVEGDERESS